MLLVLTVKLIETYSIKCGEIEDFNTIREILASIINKWRTPVIKINENGDVEDRVYCSALKILGVKYIPVTNTNATFEIPLDILDPYWEIEENLRIPRVYDNVVELLYKGFPTPLVKLKYLSNQGVNFWAKLEWYNPFSLSVKDRIAWYMLTKTLENFNNNVKVLYEATSTNTGLALAGLSNYYGLKTRLYLPITMQKCVDYLFQALGAEVVRKGVSITTEMIDDVKREAVRDNAVNLNQFENDYNFYVHLRYTAKELEYQTLKKGFIPDAVIVGVGTSGHGSAISFYFKNKYGSRVKVYAVQPKTGSIIPGIRRVETGMKWIHYVELDGIVDVSLEEAFMGLLEVARSDGLLIGLSAGAVAYAASKLVENGEVKDNIVAVFPDHGTKYIELIEGLMNKICLFDEQSLSNNQHRSLSGDRD